jgi:hypothetical protein
MTIATRTTILEIRNDDATERGRSIIVIVVVPVTVVTAVAATTSITTTTTREVMIVALATLPVKIVGN